MITQPGPGLTAAGLAQGIITGFIRDTVIHWGVMIDGEAIE